MGVKQKKVVYRQRHLVITNNTTENHNIRQRR